MYISVAKSGRADVSQAEFGKNPKMRLSDFILAVSGVIVLGAFCLLLLAGLVDEAEELASVATGARDS